MLNRVKHIIVFGGGTSGWLTAAYMVNKVKFPCKITVIESTSIGPIGVGEGTQPYTARFLHDAGLNPRDWMKPSAASFKYGVLLKGWNDNPYFVDNDFIENNIMAPDLYPHDYFIGKDPQELFDWMPACRLALNNVSPKLGGFDHTISLDSFKDFGAVHFSAMDIVDTLRDLIKDKITYINTNIVTINKDENGITELIDDKGTSYTADLYLDCSGFKAKLIEETLGVPFTDISDILPCDRAVAIPTEFKDPYKECHPYTESTTMKAGWRWKIPTFKRIGNGYVYSSKFITPEVAEQELREAIEEYDAPAKHLSMRCGSHQMVAYKNVVAIGLAAGFVEPLEATGITFTTAMVETLTNLLNIHEGLWTPHPMKILNNHYGNVVTEIIAFVWAHYYYSTRSDTEFWKNIRNKKLEDAPEYIQIILDQYNKMITRSFFLNPKTSGFNSGQWFSMLNANNIYKEQRKLTDAQLKYAEYYIKLKRNEIDQAIQTFPNHYEYLKEWYND